MFLYLFFRFFTLLLVYLIAGVLIKRYKMGVESVPEVIPNFEFWAGIPSLVKVNRSGFLPRYYLTFNPWNTEPRIQKSFSCGIRIPGLWKLEYSSRNPQSHSNDWNPESST